MNDKSRYDWYSGEKFLRWREERLLAAERINDMMEVVEIKNPAQLSVLERDKLREQCQCFNFVIYRLSDVSEAQKSSIRALAEQVGMTSLDNNLCADKDSLSSITVKPDYAGSAGYIPYTKKGLSWHTDGYYNPIQQHIRSFLLHCVRPAESGGENYLLNHEHIYIQLRDENEALAQALMHPEAMGIPENSHPDEVRAAQYGPVFYVDNQSGHLQMRYTSRTRSIVWREDPLLKEAVARLREMISVEHPQAVRYRLSAGEGIITNNILHARSAFTDGNIPSQGRLLYRARSYQRLFEPGLKPRSLQEANHVVAK